jgi:hypothetical protein
MAGYAAGEPASSTSYEWVEMSRPLRDSWERGASFGAGTVSDRLVGPRPTRRLRFEEQAKEAAEKHSWAADKRR